MFYNFYIFKKNLKMKILDKSNYNNLKLRFDRKLLDMQNLFKKMNQPKLCNQDTINDSSFHSNINKRKKDLKKIYGNTGLEFKNDFYKLLKKNINNQLDTILNDNLSIKNKSNKKNENSKSRNKNKNKSSNKIIKNNRFNLTSSLFYETVNTQSTDKNGYKTPIINYKKNSYNLSYENTKEYLHHLNKKQNNSIDNYPSLTILNNKQVNIILGNKKPKKFIDFDSINLKTISQKDNDKGKSMDNTNITDDKSITVYINSEYKINDSVSLAHEIKRISNNNDKTSKNLTNILNQTHYFPFITNSFKDDIYDIANKKFILQRPCKYRLKYIKNNDEKFTKYLNNYWKGKKNDKGFIALVKKHEKIKRNINSKIYNDIKKAESLQLELKFGTKNLNLFEKLLQHPSKKKKF